MKFPIFTVLFLILGLGMFGGIIYSVIYEESEIKEVDCFDKYGNKMLDQVCLEEPMNDSEKFPLIIIGFLLLITFILIGWVLDGPLFGEGY